MERMKNVKLDKCYLALCLCHSLQTNHFEPFQRTEDLCMDIRPLHKCTTKRAISIQVVDEYGTLLYKYFGRKFQYTFFV